LTGPVVIAGNLSLDDTITPDRAFLRAPGGDALYASIAVRSWGVIPTLLTLVGEDYPEADLVRIAATEIDVEHVRRTAGPTIHYRVSYTSDVDRIFEWISSPDRLILTSPVAADYGALAGAAWLHVAAMPIEAQEVGVAAARAAGIPVSLDPHEEYIRGYEPRLATMVAGITFMPSDLEARLLFPDLDAVEGLEFGFAAAERLDDWGPALTAIKLGPNGSVVRQAGRSVHVPATAVRVVDPTGAGDAYCGGFIAGWLATRSPEVAAGCGAVAAGEAIGTFGAFPSDPPGRQARFDRLVALLADRAEQRLLDAVRKQLWTGTAG
jgi:sugar/nucleoside kinase (ribokinase family)